MSTDIIKSREEPVVTAKRRNACCSIADRTHRGERLTRTGCILYPDIGARRILALTVDETGGQSKGE